MAGAPEGGLTKRLNSSSDSTEAAPKPTTPTIMSQTPLVSLARSGRILRLDASDWKATKCPTEDMDGNVEAPFPSPSPAFEIATCAGGDAEMSARTTSETPPESFGMRFEACVS